VLYIKRSRTKTFVIVDAAMNDLIRPALYGAHHEIFSLRKSVGKSRKVDVVGPICESGDFFAKNRSLSVPREGDFLAIMSAGAYGFSMASNYNSRMRCSEIMVKGNRFYAIREKESYQDLIDEEVIPKFLK